MKDYDPYGDMVQANRDEMMQIYGEGLRRAQEALNRGFPETAKLVINMALVYHPMYEDWPGWPAEPWAE